MNWGGEYMQNLHLQIHPVFNPMLSRAIIWDFRLRIADCGFVESLRSINFNGQNSLNLKSKIQNCTQLVEEQKWA
jgi:hypothetical protein